MPNGSLLNGRYLVQRVIGIGSFGRIYLALDTQDTSNPPIAVKELLDSQFKTPQDKQEAITWFKREVSTLLNLEHPAIPAIHGYWTAHHTSGPFYLAMDYIPGKTLADIMQEVGGQVNWRVVVVWGIVLCDVLAYLHGRTPPFVFRDMKLQNVMIHSQTSRPVLIDFGITRQLAPTGGTAIGTWGYVPYEQILGHAAPPSDIYALGATLHALLTGRHPDVEYARLIRSGLSVEDAMRSLFPSADTLVADVPLALASVLCCATSFDASHRYPDAASLANALRQANSNPNLPIQPPFYKSAPQSRVPGSGSGTANKHGAAPSPSSTPASFNTLTTHKAVHQGMRVQVQRFVQEPKLKGEKPSSGNGYYLLRLLIVNDDAQKHAYHYLNFKLQGPDSLTYAAKGYGSATPLEYGTLGPGQSIAGDIAFEAPAGQVFHLLWTVSDHLPPIHIPLT